MVKVIWTNPAIEDLKSIKDYVSRESEVYASRLVEQIINRVEQLTNFPRSGRIESFTKSKQIILEL